MIGDKRELGECGDGHGPRTDPSEILEPKFRLDQISPFNKSANYKNPVDTPDIINISHIALIDRIQLSLRPHHNDSVLSDLNSMFRFTGTKRKPGRLIWKFVYRGRRIEFVKWFWKKGKPVYYSSLISYQPDDEMQYIFLELLNTYRMTLSQLEIAFDFYPKLLHDLYPLRRIITYGIILRHSRADFYSRYLDTEYMGKHGNKRKGSKGSTFYNKQHEGRKFVRIELLFNRGFIKRNGISLPVNVDDFNLFDFMDYRHPLDKKRLEELLYKRQIKACPVEKAADVRIARELERETIRSHVDWVFMYGPSNLDGNPVVADQISNFKLYFENDNLANRVSEFFPKSNKKALISQDIKNGVVKTEY
jgi:hypothetical protein